MEAFTFSTACTADSPELRRRSIGSTSNKLS
jgi:hypothetical protein